MPLKNTHNTAKIIKCILFGSILLSDEKELEAALKKLLQSVIHALHHPATDLSQRNQNRQTISLFWQLLATQVMCCTDSLFPHSAQCLCFDH